MDLTNDISIWINTPEQERDTLAGARLLLQVNKNKILYNNALRNPAKFAKRIEYELGKILSARLANATKEQSREMVAKAEKICYGFGVGETINKPKSDFQLGKRSDHDSLPDHIKKLYSDNAEIRLKIRECHLRLRMISHENSTCPDSDRYAWAKEIVKLDTQYRKNWKEYDQFARPQAMMADKPSSAEDASRTALRLINLNKGRLRKSRDAALLEKMKGWASQLINPSEKVVEELKSLGVL